MNPNFFDFLKLLFNNFKNMSRVYTPIKCGNTNCGVSFFIYDIPGRMILNYCQKCLENITPNYYKSNIQSTSVIINNINISTDSVNNVRVKDNVDINMEVQNNTYNNNIELEAQNNIITYNNISPNKIIINTVASELKNNNICNNKDDHECICRYKCGYSIFVPKIKDSDFGGLRIEHRKKHNHQNRCILNPKNKNLPQAKNIKNMNISYSKNCLNKHSHKCYCKFNCNYFTVVDKLSNNNSGIRHSEKHAHQSGCLLNPRNSDLKDDNIFQNEYLPDSDKPKIIKAKDLFEDNNSQNMEISNKEASNANTLKSSNNSYNKLCNNLEAHIFPCKFSCGFFSSEEKSITGSKRHISKYKHENTCSLNPRYNLKRKRFGGPNPETPKKLKLDVLAEYEQLTTIYNKEYDIIDIQKNTATLQCLICGKKDTMNVRKWLQEPFYSCDCCDGICEEDLDLDTEIECNNSCGWSILIHNSEKCPRQQLLVKHNRVCGME